MDERCTLPVNGDFTEIIRQLIIEKTHADLILDINGLERAAGIITNIDGQNEVAVIQLDNERIINVNSIVAINGLFKSDYTCC